MARGRENEEWGKERRREKGEGGKKKKEISSERDAPSSRIRVGVLDPSSVHHIFTRLRRSTRRPRPSLPPLFLVSHARINRIHSRTPGPSSNLNPPPLVLSRTEPYHPPFERKEKKKAKKTHGVLSADHPTFNTGARARTIGLLRQPLSSASHPPRLSSRNPVEEDLVLRLVTLLPSPSELASATRSPSNHLPWGGTRSLHRRRSSILVNNNSPRLLFTTCILVPVYRDREHDFPSRGPSPSHARSSRIPSNGAQAAAAAAQESSK